MNESIIVYRNPAEQWFWESGAAIYFFGTVLLGLLVCFVIYKVKSFVKSFKKK